jgi:hypothetical protein
VVDLAEAAVLAVVLAVADFLVVEVVEVGNFHIKAIFTPIDFFLSNFKLFLQL